MEVESNDAKRPCAEERISAYCSVISCEVVLDGSSGCGSDRRKQYPLLSLTKLFLDVLLCSGSKGTERRTVTRLLSAADRIKGGDDKSK